MEKKYNNPAAFSQALLDLLNEYLANEEAYGDNPQLEVKLPTLDMSIMPEPDEDETEGDKADYYPVLDLVSMSIEEPGRWMPDTEAVEDVTGEYFDR